jgi:hypothetical protein
MTDSGHDHQSEWVHCPIRSRVSAGHDVAEAKGYNRRTQQARPAVVGCSPLVGALGRVIEAAGEDLLRLRPGSPAGSQLAGSPPIFPRDLHELPDLSPGDLPACPGPTLDWRRPWPALEDLNLRPLPRQPPRLAGRPPRVIRQPPRRSGTLPA